MGQGDSKASIIARKESTRTFSNNNSSSSSLTNTTRSVQLTEKEKKKLQQLQLRAEAKKSRQIKQDEKDEEKSNVKVGRERAATKIQAAMRGTIGRKKFIKFREERERKAATKIQAVARGWLCRRVFKSLKGRTIVARELLATERDYVRYLSMIIQIYINPLRLMDENNHPLLTGEEMKMIFSQIEVVYSYNSQFLVSLEYNIGKKWSYAQTVGDVFLTFVEFFRAPYKQFIMRFSEVSQAIDICAKRSGVEAFFTRCRKRPECGNRNLHNLMSMPFQRLPRYILLLKELLKYTISTHDDSTYIRHALQKMEELAASANEQIRHFELTNAVLEISKRFEPPIQNLVSPYRKFKREGDLKCKKENANEKFYDAVIFLFSDVIVASVKMTGKSVPKYRPKLIVHLKNCVVLDCADRDGAEEGEKSLRDSWSVVEPGDIPLSSSINGGDELKTKHKFEFRIHSLNESVVFRADNQGTKDAWMGDIITEVNQLTENKLTSHPLWRSKASYGIASLRKKSLQRNRNLSQTQMDPSSLPRKDSSAQKEAGRRKDSNVGVPNAANSKHFAELNSKLASVLASKRLLNTSGSVSRTGSVSEAPSTNATDSGDNTEHNPIAISYGDAEKIAFNDNLATIKEEEKVTQNSSEQSPKETDVSPPVAISSPLPVSEKLLPVDAIEETNGNEHDSLPSSAEVISASQPIPDPGASYNVISGMSDSVLIVNPTLPSSEPTPQIDLTTSNIFPPDTVGYSDLATSLHLELQANVTSEVDEVLSMLTDKIDSSLIDNLEDSAKSVDLTDMEMTNTEKYEPFQRTDSPLVVSPNTPKPTPRPSPIHSNVEALRGSRPLLSASSSPGSSHLPPLSLSPLHDGSENNIISPRKSARAPPLDLDISGGFSPRKDSPTSSSVASSRFPAMFDPPKAGRGFNPSAERSSPLFGKPRLSVAIKTSPSEEHIPPVSPKRSPSTGFSPSFSQQARAGRMARLSKYEMAPTSNNNSNINLSSPSSPSPSSSPTPMEMHRSASISSDSCSESDSFIWRSSIGTGSSTSLQQVFTLPEMFLPRSISADAILAVYPHSYATNNQDDARDDSTTTTTTSVAPIVQEIIDEEVLQILCSRFRSTSFSNVEDLLDYGFCSM